ncbi:plastocyanin/azurin family copper-binding protein [Phormidesmis priestleyi]
MKKPVKKPVLWVVVAALAVGTIACNKEQASEPESSPAVSTAPQSASAKKSALTKVTVTETEMAIKLSPTTVPAGPVEFVVSNKGKVPHEFVLLRTDLPLDKLPTKTGGKLDEKNKQLKAIAEVDEDDLKKGATKPLKVILSKGRYVVICNVDNHFEQGMKAALTVQ